MQANSHKLSGSAIDKLGKASQCSAHIIVVCIRFQLCRLGVDKFSELLPAIFFYLLKYGSDFSVVDWREG